MNNKKNNKDLTSMVKNNQRLIKKNAKALNENRKAIKGNRKILDNHSKKLSSLEDTLTQVVAVVVENTAEIKEMKENMMTKEDKDEILSAISEFASRTQSNEEQIIIGGHQLIRTDEKVDKIEADVRLIKPLVGLR